MKGRLLLVLLLSHLVGWGVEGTIDTVEYVNFKPENWQGKDDLSFTYKLEVVDNAIELTVDVTDQTVLLKDGDSIVSDHVELWLFDPAIMEEVQGFKKGLDDAIAERKDESFEFNSEDAKEDNNRVIHLLKEQYSSLNKTKYLHQYIFNKDKISTFPSFKLNEKIHYSYSLSDKGYTFHLQTPILRSMTIKSEDLKKLGYLVSVSDVDDGCSVKQEKLMNSAKSAKFNQPDTYNTVKINLELDMDDPAKLYQILSPDGIFSLTKNGYEYHKKVLLTYEMYGEEDVDGLPIGYERLVSNLLLDKQGFKIQYYLNNLIVENESRVQIVDLKTVVSGNCSEYELLDFQKKENVYYILFTATGNSNWFDINQRCWDGVEVDLILVSIETSLSKWKSEGITLDSCWGRQESKKEEKLGIISYRYLNWSDKKEGTVTYTICKPEDGLVVTESDFNPDE